MEKGSIELMVDPTMIRYIQMLILFAIFSTDSVDCGSGIDTVFSFYSGDIETVTYCENIRNNDGQVS